jgi:uncharacterized membrane protein YheB (UPF0754 family)
MSKNLINENVVKNILDKLISEEVSKVQRHEFNRVQFKIEDLQNSLNDTIRELRKLNDSIPNGLKTLTSGRMTNIEQNLISTQKTIIELKEKVKQQRKKLYTQQVVEKKK